MLRILLTIVLPLALWVWAFIDCLVTPEGEVKHLPKPIWLIVVLLFPPLGPIAWLVAGRQRGFLRAGAPDGRPGRQAADDRPGFGAPRGGRQVAPDDDPEFLASLGNESPGNESPEAESAGKSPGKGESLQKGDKDHEDMLRRWEADLRRREQELRRGDEPEDGRKS